MSRKKKTTAGDVISIILMAVAFCVFVFSGLTLFHYYREYKKGTDEYNSLEESYTLDDEDFDSLDTDDLDQRVGKRETVTVWENGSQKEVPLMKNPINFKELKKENSDIVGWLRLRALDISYPVLQGKDNEFYLHHTFEKEYNFAGCIFENCDNKPNMTDQNTIIYGHNMRNGSMFGTISQLGKPEVFNKSKFFWMFTPDLIYQYRIFSVCVVGNTGIAYQTFYTDKEFKELIDYAYSHSEVDTSGVEVKPGDRIMTLSTCTGDASTRRVVFGKLVQIYASRE